MWWPLIKKIMLAAGVALVLRACVMETYRVSGAAMLPALVPGDVILTSKVHYGLRMPGAGALLWSWRDVAPGDVVVLSDVGEPPMTIIRRIVAVPGDVVKVEKGEVLLKKNDQWQAPFECVDIADLPEFCRKKIGNKEIIVHRPNHDQQRDLNKKEIALSTNEVFVISDDQRDGPDSRHFGPVALESIVGAVIRVWIPARDPQKKFPVDQALVVKINERPLFAPVL